MKLVLKFYLKEDTREKVLGGIKKREVSLSSIEEEKLTQLCDTHLGLEVAWSCGCPPGVGDFIGHELVRNILSNICSGDTTLADVLCDWEWKVRYVEWDVFNDYIFPWVEVYA